MKKSEDLKTILEYVSHKDNQIKEEVLNTVQQLREQVSESVFNQIIAEVKTNSDFRGERGFTGQDGESGPQGPQGRQGPVPTIEISEDQTQIRFQKGTLLNEDTGESLPHYTDWIDIKGDQGERGLIGEQGPKGEDGTSFTKAVIFEDHLHIMNSNGETYDLGNVRGPIGESGPQGPKGDSLTWHDLTESQRQLLVGPSGAPGPKGDPGSFPMVECDHEERKIRFQVREDYTNPWGEWIDMPVGPQGEQGNPFLYEDFTQQQLMGLQGPTGEKGDKGDKGDRGERGPMGPRGPQGEQGLTGEKGDKGDKGEKGDPGKDADIEPFEEKIEKFKEKVVKDHTAFDKRIKDTTEKLRNEITNRISDVRFTRLNELLIPTQAFNVAGDPVTQEIFQEIDVDNVAEIVTGSPVYIDNTIKASIRGDTYDADNWLIYASAEHISQIADGIVVRGSSGKQAYIYRLGVVTIDSKAIADGANLVPGEYYYLAHPSANSTNGQITANKPTYGIAQQVGQAISRTQLFVNTTTEPAILNRTQLQIQGRNGATIAPPTDPRGTEGDAFGDVIWDDSYLYYTVKDYDGVSKIWRRVLADADW